MLCIHLLGQAVLKSQPAVALSQLRALNFVHFPLILCHRLLHLFMTAHSPSLYRPRLQSIQLGMHCLYVVTLNSRLG